MQLHDAEVAIEDLKVRMSWESMITDWKAYAVAWDKHSVPLARVLATNSFLNVASAFGCLASLERARAKDDDDAKRMVAEYFNPSADILDKYLRQVKAAKLPILKAAYTRSEKRKGVDRAAIDAITRESPGQEKK